MGNNISTSTGNKSDNGVSTGLLDPNSDARPVKYKNSMRMKRRPRVTTTTIDTRATKISRGCVRPRIKRGTQWEDPCFPREMAMEKSSLEGRQYRWMRPKEFCDSPTLVNDKPSRHDVIQGCLGNCWMMATLAGIADYQSALLQIIGSLDYNPSSRFYDGVFHCRLWHYGQWVDVFVDDCLPVTYNPSASHKYSLIGARSPDPNVLWVALVEKALAKFHGSYYMIESREREYGWRLLTGGVPGVLEQDKLRRTPTDKLFKRIKDAVDIGCIVTCARVVSGGGRHAYTVTGARAHSTKGNIIRIRNPWGEEKDRITWLDKPERWTYASDENAADFECKEGEFWMMRGECYREFTQFCIGCFKAEFVDDADEKPYVLNHRYTFYGEWKGDAAAGADRTNIFNNPKFQIRIPGNKQKKKKIMLELSPRPVDNLGVRLFLYEINKTGKSTICEEVLAPGDTHRFLGAGCPQHKYSLTPGIYMVIPVLMEKSQEREFCLRLYSNSKLKAKATSRKCFHFENKRNTDIPDKKMYFAGNWKSDLHVNEKTLAASLIRIPQYHVKCSKSVRISIDLLHEFKDRNDGVCLNIYKVPDGVSLPVSRDFIEKDHARTIITPSIMKGAQNHCDIQLDENISYLVLPFPWESTRDRDYVMVLGMDATDGVECNLVKAK